MQGLGAPACAKLLTQWYSSSERGTAWAIWTASNNVGGFIAPWIAGGAAGALGWRYGMWVPAACALAIASVIIFTITDKPTDKGFPPAEGAKAAPAKADAGGGKAEAASEKSSVRDILMKDVLPNPFVWLFALSYFFVCAATRHSTCLLRSARVHIVHTLPLNARAWRLSNHRGVVPFCALVAGVLTDTPAQVSGTAGRVHVVRALPHECQGRGHARRGGGASVRPRGGRLLWRPLCWCARPLSSHIDAPRLAHRQLRVL